MRAPRLQSIQTCPMALADPEEVGITMEFGYVDQNKIPNIRNAYGFKLSLEYELTKYFFGGPALVAKIQKWAKVEVLKLEATSSTGVVESLYPSFQPPSR